MTLRSLCSGVLFVLFFSVTISGQRRTERFASQAATAVSPNGQTIAIARSSDGVRNRNGFVELWDSTSGALQRVITGFDGPIWSISFSKDGRSLITVSTEIRKPKTQPSNKAEPDPQTAELKWWDVHSGEFLRRKLLGSEGVNSVEASWSPAGDVVALIERYSPGQWVPVVGQRMASDWVNNVELKLGLFDVHSLERRSKLEGGQQTSRGEAVYLARMAHPVFSSDGEVLAAISGTDVKLWRENRHSHKSVDVVATSSNGELIAEATQRQVSLTEVRTGAKKILSLQTDRPISAIAHSADGRSLVSADELGDIQFWEVSTGHLTKTIETGQVITALAVDTSRQILAAATADRWIGLWSVRTGTLEVELKKQRDVVRGLAFSPDGRTLASGGDDRNLILWELGSGKATLTFEKGDTAITSIAFSPDGKLLASDAGNESIFLWNVKTGRLERILR